VSWAIWITGPAGTATSAVARAAAADLEARGERVEVLGLDELCDVLTPVPAYDEAERDTVRRALVAIAAVLTRAGLPVIIDAAGHPREWRDLACATIGDFAEVELEGPLETAGARVAALARQFPRRTWGPARTEGWTVWLSGRPGSGKTTLTSALCERLAARGAAVVVLDPGEFASAIVPLGAPTPRERDVVTRAIVESARRLSGAGVAVIVDGAAPCRDAGCLARGVLEDFVQVELACEPELCRTRERAVRWNLVPCPGATRPMAAPELGLAYESAVAPDLILYTDVLDERMATEEIWRLVECLRRAAQERSRSCA
jgi:adenylylsulfate kinase-like enzyme